MKRSHSLVIAAIILLLAALYLILRPATSHSPESPVGDRKASPPVRARPNTSTDAAATDADSKEVSLPGLPPVRYSGRRDMTMGQIMERFGTIEEIYPDAISRGPEFKKRFGSKAEIFTDDDDNLLAFRQNSGLIPTASRMELAITKFREKGVEITRIGNATANLRNRTFVLGLLNLLGQTSALDWPETIIDNTPLQPGEEPPYRLVSHAELEIIPLTVRVIGMERVGIPNNQEIPAIMWKEKNTSGATKPTFGHEWTEDFPYYESHVVDWRIIFINPNPQDGDFTKVFPTSDIPNYPGVGLGRFYEKRIPRPGEPPITPPEWNPTTRQWKMRNDPR